VKVLLGLLPVLVWTLAAPSWVPFCRFLAGAVVILIVILIIGRLRFAG
jgi:hypothetical protein